MATFAVDVDDSSASMVEMTQAEIGAFRPSSKSKPKQKRKSLSKDKKKRTQKQTKTEKQKRKGKDKGHSNDKDTDRKSKRGRKPKKQEKSAKKSKKRSSSSSESEQKPRQRRQRKKSEPYVIQTPQQRFGKQIKEGEIVKYGNAKFVKNGSKSPVAFYSQKAKDTLRTGVTWWILNGDYVDENWPRIFCDMYELQVGDLRINNNNHPAIIKQFHHVRFDNLGILNLNQNNIYSVELLARMRIPLLKDLSLRSNKITTLRSMEKMSLKNLVQLSIADNYILNMDNFFCVNTESLEQIFLEWQGSPVVGRSLSWMAKLKKNPKSSKVKEYMQRVVVQSKDRISQRNVDAMLANKYRKLQLVQRKAK